MNVERPPQNAPRPSAAFAAFAVSLIAAVLTGILALWLATGPGAAVLIGIVLVIAFTVISARLGAPPRWLAVGLAAGASAFTAVIVLFDWSLGVPETSSLTLESFGKYVRLYRSPAAIVGVAAPMLITFAGLVGGLALLKLVPTDRNGNP